MRCKEQNLWVGKELLKRRRIWLEVQGAEDGDWKDVINRCMPSNLTQEGQGGVKEMFSSKRIGMEGAGAQEGATCPRKGMRGRGTSLWKKSKDRQTGA